MLKLSWRRHLLLVATLPFALGYCGNGSQGSGNDAPAESGGAKTGGRSGSGGDATSAGNAGDDHNTATAGQGASGGSGAGRGGSGGGASGGASGGAVTGGGAGLAHGAGAGGGGGHDSAITVGDGATLIKACTISEPTEWTAGVFVANCTIEVESTLTVAAGTTIKFTAGSHLKVHPGGTLTAVGTESQPIVFTSFKDDEHGGNSDGKTESPAKNDWGCQDESCGDLHIEGDGSVLDYVQELYGHNGVHINTGTVQVTNSVFAHNKSNGLFFAAGIQVKTVTANHNTFFDNDGFPLHLGTALFLDNSTIFHDPNNPDTKNGKQCVELTGDIETTTWLGVTELAYLVTGHIRGGLLIQPDTVLKAQNDSIYLEANGSFVNGPTMILTSYKDDSLGGDCTGDGDTPPEDGDWKGLWIEDATGTGYAAPSDKIRYAANSGTMVVH